MSSFFKAVQTALLCVAALSPQAAKAELSLPPTRVPAPTPLKPESQISVPGKTFIGNNPDPRFAGYLKDWIAQIGQSKFAPLTPVYTGQSFVSAEIDRGGQLVRLALLKSSGSYAFDKAVLALVRSAAPFAPLPEEIRSDTEVLVIHRAFSFDQQKPGLSDGGFPGMNRCGVDYPKESLRAEETGIARLAILLNPEGEVLAARIKKSSGHPRLDEAAIDAVALCKLPPWKVDGVPVLGWTQLEYEWRLNEE